MPTVPDEPAFLDDDHAAIVSFADTYLDEDERQDFVDGLLERRGYTRTQSWAPPEPQQGGGGQGGRAPLLKQQQRQGGQGGGGQRRRGAYFK